MAVPTGSTQTGQPSRRERVRAATVEEIKAAARSLLVAHGPASVTLRAIAREMGMTAPALYRYFPSHEDLVRTLVADIYDELADALERTRDTVPADDPAGRLVVMSRRFRRWGVTHPAEFSLVFASPVPGGAEVPSPLDKAGGRFGGAFISVFMAVWHQRPFPVPGDEELPPDLVRQLGAYRASMAEVFGDHVGGVPLGTFQAFLSCWVHLYGFVALEVFNHLAFCLDDAEPAFDAHLQWIGRVLGFTVARGLPDVE